MVGAATGLIAALGDIIDLLGAIDASRVRLYGVPITPVNDVDVAPAGIVATRTGAPIILI
jgi:hypothetical protein